MRKSGKALRSDGQRVEEEENGKLGTLTARIQSVRSSVERALHSRLTFGFVHVSATAVETRRERRRTRARPRREAICERGRGGEEGSENGCTPFMQLEGEIVNEQRRASSCFSDEDQTRVISGLILWIFGGAMQESADFQDINPMQTRDQCRNQRTQALRSRISLSRMALEGGFGIGVGIMRRPILQRNILGQLGHWD